jgi:hypothetical protein
MEPDLTDPYKLLAYLVVECANRCEEEPEEDEAA